jgi:quercetin dioxygenase-like cupin family protein
MFREGARQLRLVEFTSGEVAPDWCCQGHIGYVLSGALEIEFGGRVVSYAEGDGIFIPSGQSSAHKACSITPGTRLVMVEEI